MAATPKTTKQTVVVHKNHLVKRVITAKDLDGLTGVPGMHKDDLVWQPGDSRPVNITGHDEAVVDYFKKNKKFTVREIEAPADETPAS